MPPELSAAPGGGANLVLDPSETHVLRQLTAELRALLASDSDMQDDPVLGRLYPDAYERPEDEAAYRELIGGDLEEHKLAVLDKVSTALGAEGTDVTLGPDAVDAWLSCLTDLRLAIATRLDVDEERMGAGIDPNDPDVAALSILHWLGWLQEEIIRTVSS
jgi:hypothetical protein